MSTLRLPTFKHQYGENSGEILSQSAEKSNEQLSCAFKTSHNSMESFTEIETTDVCGDKSMLKALDNLSDHELDELLEEALALNKRLKKRLKDDSLSDRRKDQGKTTSDSSRTRNTVVLPPIVKKDSAVSTGLRANR